MIPYQLLHSLSIDNFSVELVAGVDSGVSVRLVPRGAGAVEEPELVVERSPHPTRSATVQ